MPPLRTWWKIILVALCLAVLTGIGMGVRYLRSERFLERVRLAMVSRIEQATGFSCSIERVQVSFWRGTFSIRGLTLQARPDAPLFRLKVEEAGGRLKLLSVLRLNPALAELTLVRPQLTLAMDGGGGRLDPEALLKAFQKSLDLAVGAVRVREGVIETSNRRIPIDFALNDLVCEIRHRRAPEGYQVHIAYRNSRLIWEDHEVRYDLDARGTVSMNGVDLESIGFRTGKTNLSGEGWMRDWKSPVFLFHVDGSVNSPDLAVFERHLGEASGDIRVFANLKWDSSGFHSTARYSSSSNSYRGAAVSLQQGFMEIKDGMLWLRDVRGRLGPGSFQANAAFSLAESQPAPHRLDIELKQVVMQDAARILKLPQIAYDNTVDGAVHVRWRQGSEDLEVRSDLRLNAPPGSIMAGGRSFGLRGALGFEFADGKWYFPNVELRSQQTEVIAAGKGGSNYHLRMQTSSLAEPLGLMRGFSAAVQEALRKYPDLMEIGGTYELDGDIGTNSAGEMAYRGALRVRDGRWRSYALDNLTAAAVWNGEELQLRSFELRKGAGTVTGDLELIPGPEGGRPVKLSYHGTWSRVPMKWLEDLGLKPEEEVQGILSGSGSIFGSGEGWRGEGEVAIEKAVLKGEPFEKIRARVRFDGQMLRVSDCELVHEAASVNLEGQARLDTREMDFRVKLSGFSLSSLPAIRDNKIEAEGQVTGSAEIRGTFQDPVIIARLEVEGLRYANWELGRGKGNLTLRNKRLQGDASVRSELGSATFHADISTEPGYRGSAVLELADWNLQKLIAGNMPPFLSELSTALQGKVNIEGRFDTPASLNYVGEIDGARLKIHDYELRNDGKIRFTSLNRRLQIKDARVVGEGTNLVLSGEIPTDGSETLDLRLDGQLNLKLFEHVERRVQIAGSAGLSVRATGPLRAPQVIGQAALNNVRLGWGDLPYYFSALQGNIVFSRNLVRLENIRGAAASGTVQVSGAIELQNGQLRGINLQISARQASFPYPKDFHTTADADLNLRGGPDSQVLAGEVRVTRAEYLRSLNLLEQLASRSSAPPGPLTTDPILVGLRLNVSINSSEGLYIDNELTTLRGGMRLTLRGTPAYPSLIGRVEATSGSIFFRGNRFEITRAAADFLDRNRINPILEVRAEADVRSYRLLLDVSGDLDHLRFNVTSDPPLSTVDILTMLTTGKSVEPGMESSRRQTEITGLSAASILSESLTGAIGKRVQRIFGLQTFRVDPFLAGAENDPTARVTISERVSKDLSVTFSRNLSTNEEQIVIVEYEVNRNLSIIATRDENGKYGLDFRFRRRFH
jgi:hypothetical protein